MGSPHVRYWTWAYLGCSVFHLDHGNRGPYWCQDRQLDAHAVGWQVVVYYRNEVCNWSDRFVHNRWFVGRYPLSRTIRHPADRYLLCRCPLPLCVVRWSRVWVVLWLLLLVAKNVWQDAQ